MGNWWGGSWAAVAVIATRCWPGPNGWCWRRVIGVGAQERPQAGSGRAHLAECFSLWSSSLAAAETDYSLWKRRAESPAAPGFCRAFSCSGPRAGRRSGRPRPPVWCRGRRAHARWSFPLSPAFASSGSRHAWRRIPTMPKPVGPWRCWRYWPIAPARSFSSVRSPGAGSPRQSLAQCLPGGGHHGRLEPLAGRGDHLELHGNAMVSSRC